MPSFEELAPLADESAFIFTGSISRSGASTVPTVKVDANTAIVSVEETIKLPTGMRSFAGSEVTVQLHHPLAAGQYVFFADPWAVGEGIAVRERAHLDGRQRGEAVAALERGYTARMEPHLEAAFLVALGTVGEVRPLFPPAERRGRVPWAVARFDIERILKGKGKLRRVTLVGPVPASKRLPRAPALRAGLHAILLLQHPPQDALEHLPEEERQAAAFLADTFDIQPPERLEALTQIIRRTEKE
jgi:hypothetical protein